MTASDDAERSDAEERRVSTASDDAERSDAEGRRLSTAHGDARPLFMRLVRRFAWPIIIGWLLVTVALNVLVPPSAVVARTHAVTMSPQDAPAMIAAKHIGKKFQEFDSDSMVMLVLESDNELGPDAHRYYDVLVAKLKADPEHVQHIQDLWGDPITAAGVQSGDGKAAYAQINTAGDQGSTLGNESVDAVRKIVAATPPPAGVRAYVTGQGLVALLGDRGLLGFSTFVVAMLSSLAIAAGTDYAIFLIGRYHEARNAGEDRETAWYSMFQIGRASCRE